MWIKLVYFLVVELGGFKLLFMLIYSFPISTISMYYIMKHGFKNQRSGEVGRGVQADFKNSNNHHKIGAVLGLLVQEKLQNI